MLEGIEENKIRSCMPPTFIQRVESKKIQFACNLVILFVNMRNKKYQDSLACNA